MSGESEPNEPVSSLDIVKASQFLFILILSSEKLITRNEYLCITFLWDVHFHVIVYTMMKLHFVAIDVAGYQL